MKVIDKKILKYVKNTKNDFIELNMHSFNELRQFLYTKYFDIKDPMIIIDNISSGRKMEMPFLDFTIINSIKKHIPNYEFLGLFGDISILNKVNNLKNLIEKFENEFKHYEKNLNNFIKDYQIDFEEMDFLTLQLINNYIKGD